MPMNKSKYPKNWKQISEYIRFERANNHCEWCNAENHKPHPQSGSKVVLTTAHIGIPKYPGDTGDKSDTMDCRYNNLVALCQKCHINFDIKEHVENARYTRLAKKAALIKLSGQLSMWETT